ncbi:MAG: hypothetical protein E6G92_03055 [Alphaproteobacteria bacterium]|nr:MAG: hypothetical protein E6G92_03055 [Alphaproteobacteria bacterium]
MNEARPFASLSSGLLARKGTARPAMRPQGYVGGFEDLGWNDMGYNPEPPVEEELPEHIPSSIAALTPSPRGGGVAEPDEPEVVAQQRAIAENFESEDYDEPEEIEQEAEAPEPVVAKAPTPIVKLPKRPRASLPVPSVAPGKKAAFTLRLDAERHLRLRLATAVTRRSAQHIVTAALDQFLASIPEVESLAERVPASGGKRN